VKTCACGPLTGGSSSSYVPDVVGMGDKAKPNERPVNHCLPHWLRPCFPAPTADSFPTSLPIQILTDLWIWQIIKPIFFHSLQLRSSFWLCLFGICPTCLEQLTRKRERVSVRFLVLFVSFPFRFNYSLVFWHGFFSRTCTPTLNLQSFRLHERDSVHPFHC
jgi:hypothetical protein